jgi:hypothetical protein
VSISLIIAAEHSRLTGVTVKIEQGYIVSCVPGLSKEANAWAAASAGD